MLVFTELTCMQHWSILSSKDCKGMLDVSVSFEFYFMHRMLLAFQIALVTACVGRADYQFII